MDDATRAQLRLAADSQLNADAPPGSLYLYSLAVTYLAAPEEDAAAEMDLERLFVEQARREKADGDEILRFLTMEVP